MKCSKCKNEVDKNAKYCNYCGNKLSATKNVINIIVDIILYFLSLIFLLFTLVFLFNSKAIISAILMLICTISTCPLTYKAISKNLSFFNNIALRVVIIVVAFLVSMFVSGAVEKTPNIANETNKEYNEQKNQTEQSEIKNEVEDTKEDEEEKARKEAEIKKQEEIKAAAEKEEQEKKAKEEEAKRAEEQAREERRKNGETILNNGKFTLKEGHNSYFDGFSYHITGELVNNTNRKYTYVQIEFNVYDSNGTQLGSAIDNINNLEANGTWKFDAISFGSGDENIASYKVIEVSAF